MSGEPSAIEIEFSDTQLHMRIDRPSLVELVNRVLHLEGCLRASISIVVVDNDMIHRINRTHLGHDWPTDVITFPLSQPADPVMLGELVVSAEMACETARERSEDSAGELALYIVHGLLHLCGYDDRTEADAAVMRQREREALAAAGLPSRSA
jgi:probable rRNA maturation factor